jgi:hypothetical protein
MEDLPLLPRRGSISGRRNDAQSLHAYEAFRTIQVLHAFRNRLDTRAFQAHEVPEAIGILLTFRRWRDSTEASHACEVPEAVIVLCTDSPFVAEGLACSDVTEKIDLPTNPEMLVEQHGHEFFDIDERRNEAVAQHGDEDVSDVCLEFVHEARTFICQGYGLVAFHPEGLAVLEVELSMSPKLDGVLGACQGGVGKRPTACGPDADDQQHRTDEMALHCLPSFSG